jgi:phosphohistidine phosphatase
VKTVYLLRHAKSGADDPALKDHDRMLNERGREAAPKVGAYIKLKLYRPDTILCSTALRTIETFDLIKEALGGRSNVKFEETLYLAELRHLIERLRWLDDGLKSAMIIGHNPGLEELANNLPRTPANATEEKLHKRMREKFSTCALAVIKLPAKAWREVNPGTGTLIDFVRPRDL